MFSRIGLVLSTLLLALESGLGQDTIWVRQYDLGSDEQFFGVTSRGGEIIGVGYYTDPSNYDREGLGVLFTQSGDTLATHTLELDGNEMLMDAFIDQNKNRYVAGYGSLVTPYILRPIPLLRNLSLQEVYYCIIIKVDSMENVEWAIIDTPYVTIGVGVDSAGNCYATGHFGSFSSGTDLAIVKIRPEGDTAWVRRFDTNFIESFYRCAIDHFGNVVTSGFAVDLLTFTFKGILAKVNPEGETLWLRTFSLDSFTALVGVDVDRYGNVVATGFCGNSKNIDLLVLKTDSMGDTLWIRRFDYTEDDEGLGVVCDSEGYIFATGYFADGDCRLLKITPFGELSGAFRYDQGGYEYFQDITIDESGYPICVGFTDFSPTPYDLLIAKLSPTVGLSELQVVENKEKGRSNFASLSKGRLIFDTSISGKYRIEIFDLVGKKATQNFQPLLNTGKNSIPIPSLPNGVYIIQITGPSGEVLRNKAVMVK